MKDQLTDLLALDDVKGVVILDAKGNIAFQKFNEPPPASLAPDTFQQVMHAIASIRELEVMFENVRLYIRKYAGGVLIVITGHFALVAMVRLNCDIVVPTLSVTSDKPKGLGRFFKR